MHFNELTEVEQRVLGCLIEKRWTTPDQYPLSLNALRLACNQSTNRDPVTRYADDDVYRAAQRLTKYGLARLASGHSSRATKYRHLAEEALGLGREQLAVLCVLLLRGPQTPGELKQRSERMAPLASLADVERVLAALGERGYVTSLGRRPGQKEDRFAQLLGGEPGDGLRAPAVPRPGHAPADAAPTHAPPADAPPADAPLADAPLAHAPPADAPPADAPPADARSADAPPADRRPSPDPDGRPRLDPAGAATADVVALQARLDALESGMSARVSALEGELAALREQLADLLD